MYMCVTRVFCVGYIHMSDTCGQYVHMSYIYIYIHNTHTHMLGCVRVPELPAETVELELPL